MANLAQARNPYDKLWQEFHHSDNGGKILSEIEPLIMLYSNAGKVGNISRAKWRRCPFLKIRNGQPSKKEIQYPL
jgi:hypothetical protein